MPLISPNAGFDAVMPGLAPRESPSAYRGFRHLRRHDWYARPMPRGDRSSLDGKREILPNLVQPTRPAEDYQSFSKRSKG
jgi:hypothetical protein